MSFADAFEGADEIRRVWLAGLGPDPNLTVSEWADRHRVLSTRGASEAGPYRTARTPYMREIMDALSTSHPARRVTFMKSAQIGATEAGNNWLGYIIAAAPAPTMMVMQTLDAAKDNSMQRIDPLIEESPILRERIPAARSRDSGNKQLSKRFPGGVLFIRGANSPTGLRSMPARFVFLDEVDAYDGDVGGEGDPVQLVAARTLSFGYRAKMFLASTPLIQGASRIEREYEMSDQRRYFAPCPHCGALQWLQFERLRWDKGKPSTVHYVCEHCADPILEREKTWMLDEANGAEWRPTAPLDVLERADEQGHIGFHINSLYSPLGWLSWKGIAEQWEAAQGNSEALKTFKNTVLGETWLERGEAPDWQRLYDRREGWMLGTAPEGALVLTAGADVQRDRIEVDIWGWGRKMQSWLVDHIAIDGDPMQPPIWAELTDVLGRAWPHENGERMALAQLAIDSGDGKTTDAVYAWCRQVGHQQVMAIKGGRSHDPTMPVQGPTYVETTAAGRKIRRGVRLWTIGVSIFKAETYRFLWQNAPTDEDFAEGADWPPGYVHIPQGASAEWCKQLVAEHLVYIKTRAGGKRPEWRQLRERNEALDCRVYARAAAWLMGVDRWDERRWGALEAQFKTGEADPLPAGQPNREPRKQAPVRRSSWMGPRKGNWF